MPLYIQFIYSSCLESKVILVGRLVDENMLVYKFVGEPSYQPSLYCRVRRCKLLIFAFLVVEILK